MTKNHGVADKIVAGIRRHLEDTRQGRRSVRWLAEQAGINPSTLHRKLAADPGSLTMTELLSVCDVFGIELDELYDHRVEVAA